MASKKLNLNIEFKKGSFRTASFEYIFKPLAILVTMLILVIVVLNIAFSRVNAQKENIAKEEKNQEILLNKRDLLTALKSESLSYADFTTTALPNGNPALIFLSQLKSVSEEHSVTIQNLTAGAETSNKTGVQLLDMSFDVEGQVLDVLRFLKTLETEIAPIATVSNARVTELAGAARAETSVFVYFSEFPTKLSALTEPITEFTNEEVDLLNTLTNLRQPAFLELEPKVEGIRINPFEY